MATGTPGPDRKATDAKLMRAVRDSYAPAVGTSQIADELNVERQTADKHLRDLADRGLLNTKMIGQVRVWWLHDDGRKWLSENE